MSYGQQTALERITNAIQSTNRDAIVLVCRHNIEDRTKPVMLKDTVVDRVYFKKRWYVADEATTDEVWRMVMNWGMDKEKGIPVTDTPWG